jgi:hypothetical protein
MYLKADEGLVDQLGSWSGCYSKRNSNLGRLFRYSDVIVKTTMILGRSKYFLDDAGILYNVLVSGGVLFSECWGLVGGL